MSMMVSSGFSPRMISRSRVLGEVGRWIAAASLLAAVGSSVVRADQVVVRSTRYTGATVFGFDEGQVRFRTADGRVRSAWIDEVELLSIDRGGLFDDFNQAERFYAAGQPDRAIIRYQRALRLSESFWPDLIGARLVLACDAAKRLDQATQYFIAVLGGRSAGAPAGARLIPRAIPTKRDGRVIRALQQLDGALAGVSDDSQGALLALLRYDILQRIADDRAEEVAGAVATIPIPPPVRSERMYRIQLEAMEAAFDANAGEAALAALDRTIRDCPQTVLPSFLLLRGEWLLRAASTREEIVRAAWPFMRAAIHFPADARAAQGLYRAATALERLGRVDKAVQLLRECLGHAAVDGETRRLAEVALARLSPSAPNAGGEGAE